MKLRLTTLLCTAMLCTAFLSAAALLSACGAGGGNAADAAAVPVQFAEPVRPYAEPKDDAFYAQPPPQELGRFREGAVIRYREITAQAYLLLPLRAKAWQVMYRSNDTKNQPVADVTTLLVPPRAPDSQRLLLSYQTAYDALSNKCAPSVQTLKGTEDEQALIALALGRGWVVATADYEGPEAQWIAGVNTAHGVLDGVRAALNFEPAQLDGAQTKVGLMGYSGGGYATVWAAEAQSSYAPELNVVGAAAGGAPTNIEGSARSLDGGAFAGVYFAAAIGISRAYPEFNLDSYLNESGKKMVADIGEMCVGQFLAGAKDPLLGSYSYHKMSEYVTVPELLDLPKSQEVMAENVLGHYAPAAPLYYYHAILDELNPIADADALMAKYCSEGVTVKYKRALAAEHISLVVTEALDAIAYINDRFDGKPAPSSCK